MTLNRSYKLNLKVWGGLFSLCAFGISVGAVSTLHSLERLSQARQNSIQQNNQIAQLDRQTQLRQADIESKADIQQSYIDNNVNFFNSVVLEDYTCNPNVHPTLEWSRYTQNHKVHIVDRNQRIVGELMPSGTYYHLPENC